MLWAYTTENLSGLLATQSVNNLDSGEDVQMEFS